MQEDPTSPSLPTPRVSVYCAKRGRRYQQDAWLARTLPSDMDDAVFLRGWATDLGDMVHKNPKRAKLLARGGTTFNAAICRRLPDGQFRITAANIGDSMTILLTCSRSSGSWTAQAVTKQHSFLRGKDKGFFQQHMSSEYSAVDRRLNASSSGAKGDTPPPVEEKKGEASDGETSPEEPHDTGPTLKWSKQKYCDGTMRMNLMAYRSLGLWGSEQLTIDTGRSVGDTTFDDGTPDNPVMSHMPDISTVTINPDDCSQIYVITATDGLWGELMQGIHGRDLLTHLVIIAQKTTQTEGTDANATTHDHAPLLDQLKGVGFDEYANHWPRDTDNATILVTTPTDCQEDAVLLAVMDGHGRTAATPPSSQLGIDLIARRLLDDKLVALRQANLGGETAEASAARVTGERDIIPSLTVNLSGDTETTTVEYVDPDAQIVHEDGEDRRKQLQEQHEQRVGPFTTSLAFLTSETTLTDAQITAHLQAAMGSISPFCATDLDGYCEDIWTRFADAYWAEREARAEEEACCSNSCLSAIFPWSCNLFPPPRRDADPVMQALEAKKNMIIAGWKTVMSTASMEAATLEVADPKEEVKLGG